MNHTKNRAISCCSRECRIIFNPQIPSEPNNRLGIPTATHDYFPQIHNLFVNLRSLFRQQTPTPSPSQRRSNPVSFLISNTFYWFGYFKKLLASRQKSQSLANKLFCQEKVLCRVCFEGKISTVLLPCRHRIFIVSVWVYIYINQSC